MEESLFGVCRVVTAQGAFISFPRDWRHINDNFDEFLKNGHRNPQFVPRPSFPIIKSSHPFVKDLVVFVSSILDRPISDSYLIPGKRIWVAEGKYHLVNPLDKKTSKPSEPKVYDEEDED